MARSRFSPFGPGSPGRRQNTWLGILAACLAVLGCGPSIDCQPGGTNCDGLCVSLETNADHCGLCGFTCGAADYCAEADCKAYCGAGRSLCQGRCIGTVGDPERCGACNHACDAGEYCDAGECSDECSGVVCPTANGDRCAHLESDPEHCGECGNSCREGESCVDGACQRSCPESRLACAGECVDVERDPLNCGACAQACPLGVSCHHGICGGPSGCQPNEAQDDCDCVEGKSQCGEACVETASDLEHCGACGNACGPSQLCQDGACTCTGGLTLCDGECFEPSSSLEHCGDCDQPCAGSERCEAGTCVYVAADQCGGRAMGASITKVSWYQAVEVPLYDAGKLIADADRNAMLVAAKASTVRVHVELDAGFEARQLSARLWLTPPGGTAVLHFQKRLVQADSQQANLDSTFVFELPADALTAQTNFHVELVECTEQPGGPRGVTRVPTLGEAPLGARTTGPVRVHFVPIRFNGLLPDTSDSALATYIADAERKFPTTAIEPKVIAVMEGGTGSPNMDTLLEDLEVRRAADKPADNIYYYGLVRSHATSNDYCNAAGPDGCTLGIAYVSSTPSEQVAMGVAYGDYESAATFSHELGHNHGRDHAPNGGAGSPDEDFPYADGMIGVWGLDVGAAKLQNPANHYDFMGYDEPAWTSDYTWNGIAEVVLSTNRTTAAYQRSDQASPAAAQALATPWDSLRVDSHGTRWGSTRMLDPSGRTTEPATVFDSAGNALATLTVYRSQLADADGYRLLVPPRQPGWAALVLNDGSIATYP
ncbi:MAG TPA: M66 family metalloprotease [Polyangiaceae bacterium]|nr:M66 family metalloprotease [Polyangiaceae bacterium]